MLFRSRPLFQNVTVVALFILPMVTMRTYSEEKRSGTIELLLTSPLTDFEIVIGKFLGAMALYAAALGTLKNTSVFCPLFSAFGPEPVWQRLSRGNAKVLLTTERLYRKTVAGLRERLPDLRYILIADAEQDLDANVLALAPLLVDASADFLWASVGFVSTAKGTASTPPLATS